MASTVFNLGGRSINLNSNSWWNFCSSQVYRDDALFRRGISSAGGAQSLLSVSPVEQAMPLGARCGAKRQQTADRCQASSGIRKI